MPIYCLAGQINFHHHLSSLLLTKLQLNMKSKIKYLQLLALEKVIGCPIYFTIIAGFDSGIYGL